MASRLALSKIKGKPAPSAPLMSFRFLPSEDDLEEVTPEDQNIEKQDETGNVFRSSNTYPTSLEKVATETEVSSIPHSLSTDSNDIFRESFPDISSPQNDVAEGITFTSGNKDQNKYSASFPSESIKQTSESTHNARFKDARDSSPIKESVKDYLAKLGKRSSSLENSPATENDNWSLFNEWKGRITKTIEEKINREPIVSSKSFEKPNIQSSSQRSTQPSSPVELVSGGKDDIADYNDNSVSSPGSALSERRFTSADSTDSDRKSVSSEDQLPLSIEHDSRSITSVDDSTEDNTDMARCAIITSSSGQKKAVSTITSSTQSLLSPKRTRPNMSVTLSSLMATKVLDSDSMEEVHSELDTPDVECLENVKEMSSSEQNNSQMVDDTETCKDETTKHSASDNISKILNENKLLKEIYQAYKNLRSCWQRQMLALIIAFVACLIAPIPSFLSGFLSGFLLSAITGCFLWWLFQPVTTKEPLVIPDYTILPPLLIPQSAEQTTDIYKGWMNELPFEYNPDTYHVSNTISVYVRLDGTSLRLSYPKSNIPKRAMWNESRHDPVFIDQQHYNLAGGVISLLPEGLARKRLWSKKYPIYLEVFKSSSQYHQGENDSAKGISQRNSSNSVSSLIDGPDDSDEKELSLKHTSGVVTKLYLFARTSRDKEEWYWLLQQAMQQKTNWLKSSLSGSTSQLQTTLKDQRSFSMDLGSLNTSSYGGGSVSIDFPRKETTEVNKLDFNQYISPFLNDETWLKEFSSSPYIIHSKDKKPSLPESKSNVTSASKENMLWLNALIGRIFFNFLTEKHWSDEVTDRIQKKLSKIRVPYFIQELKLTDINLGKALPQIRRTSNPTMDNRGLWIDLDITYNGSFQMTLETKLNLLRLKKGHGVEMDDISGLIGERCFADRSRSYMQNSEEEDSAESSSDDEIYPAEIAMEQHNKASVSQHISSSGTSTSKKLLRIVDKIAQSRYFQQAAENRYIKKYMEDVSNTPLLLTVEVHGLIGTLAINIPPLPTDRFWYGFRNNPQLSISARPKLGERQVTLAPVTDWIEKKLTLEFQKILVMPNMDDLIIPIMNVNLPSARS